jgi:hypothetical protein
LLTSKNYFLVVSAAALATESTVALAESATALTVESATALDESIDSVAAAAVESVPALEPLPPQEATNTPRAKAKKPIFSKFFILIIFLGFEIMFNLYTGFWKR